MIPPRIAMCPVNHATLTVICINSKKSNNITLSQRVYSGSYIDIMCD